jgi:hypothetical protein
MALKSNFAGKSDWRLPNIAELHTIVERENYNPAINTAMFPSTPGRFFWSSSPVAYYSYYAWIVYFDVGYGNWDHKANGNYVRLVRSGQLFGFLPQTTPTTDFDDNKDGTVTHKRTGLIWQRCPVGQIWTGTTCSTSFPRAAWECSSGVLRRLPRTAARYYGIPTRRVGTRNYQELILWDAAATPSEKQKLRTF